DKAGSARVARRGPRDLPHPPLPVLGRGSCRGSSGSRRLAEPGTLATTVRGRSLDSKEGEGRESCVVNRGSPGGVPLGSSFRLKQPADQRGGALGSIFPTRPRRPARRLLAQVGPERPVSRGFVFQGNGVKPFGTDRNVGFVFPGPAGPTR